MTALNEEWQAGTQYAMVQYLQKVTIAIQNIISHESLLYNWKFLHASYNREKSSFVIFGGVGT